MRKILLVLALVGSSFSVAHADGKGSAAPKVDPAVKSLYDRLGGKDAITAVVGEFLNNVVADKRINKFFIKTDAKKLSALLVDQISAATGCKECKYKGKDMKAAHKGMNITEADFAALVEDLTKALDKFKVGEKEKGELLGALGGMKGDIVTKK
jgi:hemoglobin